MPSAVFTPAYMELLEERRLLSSGLTVTFIPPAKPPAIILPGSKQTAKFEIASSETQKTSLPITVYVSDQAALDSTDSNQQTILTINSPLQLKAGKSKNITVHFTMPASFVTGTSYILISTNQQVFSTSAMYNPSAGYNTVPYGILPTPSNDASDYLDSGTWTANGQTNPFSVNIRSLSDGSVYGDVLASGNFGQISLSNLPAHITKKGRFSIHAANVTNYTIYPPGSSSSGTSGGSDSGSGGSDGTSSGTGTGTELVNFSISGQINPGNITGSIHLTSIKPKSTSGTNGSTTNNQATEPTASQNTGSSANYTPIAGAGSFSVTPPAPSVSGNTPTPAAVLIDMSQLPTTASTSFTLTGDYPTPSYVGTITVTLTNAQGNSLAPFTTYTVNTAAGTWSAQIPIANVPDGTYTVNVTDTNTGASIPVPDSGGSITISTIGSNVHFDPSQLPLVTNADQTLTGTYDATDADGGQITGITVDLTDSSGNQTSFPATLNSGTWSAPVSLTGLADGAYTVTAVATDSAGNTGAAGAPGSFTVDTLATTLGSDVQFTGGQWLATTNTPYTINGTYTDPDSQNGPDGNADMITGITINLADSQGNVTSFPAIISNNSSNWSALINVSSLSDATYTVTATVTDSNGNTGTAAAPGTFTVVGITPAEMRGAYGLGQVGSSPITFNGVQGNGSGETIAIVDEYDDPNAQSDLEAFDEQFGLPNPPSFEKLDQNGQPVTSTNTVPTDSTGMWEGEESLDIEWAHAMAPGANIILFEAAPISDSIADQLAALTTAVQTAANTPGVDVVSMSWGFAESAVTNETQYDSIFANSGVSFVASSGDNGASTNQNDSPSVLYPSASPNVVAVGGTSLSVSGDSYSSETAWPGSGGGVSVYESQPSYQAGVVTQSSTQRTVPDVSMDAAPNTGVPIYDSYNPSSDSPLNPWMDEPIGGTSLAAPMFAAIVAVADQGRAANGQSPLGSTQTLQQLYAAAGTSDFHDVTSGSNGYYSASPGYDLVTGLGSPVANLLIPELVSAPSLNNQTSTIDLSQLPATIGADFTLTGDYPSPPYVGTITVTLTNSQGNSLAPFTHYTVNTVAGTWSAPINIAGVPDGTYTVTVTDTNTAGTTVVGTGPITISTIGSNLHFNSTQLPLVTNTNQTLTGTYDATDADGGQITGITINFTNSSGTPTSFPATLNSANHTWIAPINIANMAAGAYTVTATATDSSGNTGTAGAPGNFTIDNLVNSLGSDVAFANNTNTEQLITLPNDDSFALTFDGQTTGLINYDPTSGPDNTYPNMCSNIATALGALSNIGTGNVSVVAESATQFLVTFIGTMAGEAEPTLTPASNLAVTVQTVEIGGPGEWPIRTDTNITLNGTYTNPNGQTGLDGNTDVITAILVDLTDSQGNTKSFDATLDGAGNWSAAINIGELAGETYTVTAIVADSNGNTGVATAPGTFTVYTSGSAGPALTIDQTTPIYVNPNASTTITGTYTDADINPNGISVTIVDGHGDTKTFPATVNTSNDTWSAVVAPAGLPEGVYSITASASDLAGNSSTKFAAAQLVVDNTAEAVTINMSALPATVGADFTLTGNYPAPPYVGTIVVTLTNSQGGSIAPFNVYTVNTGSGTWSAPISIAGVPDGTYTVTATNINTDGTTIIGTGLLTISTIGSNVHFNSSQLPIVTNTDQFLTGIYDATDADGGQITSITVYLTYSSGTQTSFPATLNSANHTWIAPINIANMAAGAYTVTATATDSAGNTGTAGAPGNFTVDTLVNTLGSDVQFNNPNDAEQQITLGGADNFTLTFDGQTTSQITYDPTADTMAGNIASALEALGNIGSGNITVVAESNMQYLVTFVGAMAGQPEPTMVSSDPNATVLAVQSGYPWPVVTASNLIMGGTFTNPDSQGGPDGNSDSITAIIINLTDSQGNVKSFATTLDDGAWSALINVSSLTDGTYTVTATVFDSNGNTGTAVAPGTFTIN